MVLHVNSEFNFNLFLRLCLDGLWWPGRWMFPQRYFLADSLCWSDFQPSVCLLCLFGSCKLCTLHLPRWDSGGRRVGKDNIYSKERNLLLRALKLSVNAVLYVSCWVVSCSCTAGIPLIRQHIEIFQQVPQSNSPPQHYSRDILSDYFLPSSI